MLSLLPLEACILKPSLGFSLLETRVSMSVYLYSRYLSKPKGQWGRTVGILFRNPIVSSIFGLTMDCLFHLVVYCFCGTLDSDVKYRWWRPKASGQLCLKDAPSIKATKLSYSWTSSLRLPSNHHDPIFISDVWRAHIYHRMMKEPLAMML